MKKPIDHWNASSTVSVFNYSTPTVVHASSFAQGDYTGQSFSLEYKEGGFPIRVAFHSLKNRDDVIRIISSNWRCEDEPNGIYDIKAARKFYRDLVSAGFVAF